MSNNTESEKDFGECKNIPINYLFAAHYDNSAKEVMDGYRPIPGAIIITETMVFEKKGDICSKPEKKLRPWFTNYNGVLNHLNNDFSEGTRWYALSDTKSKTQKVFSLLLSKFLNEHLRLENF